MTTYAPALARANAVHVHRAELKRELKSGRLILADALEESDLGSMLVFELLLNLPGFAARGRPHRTRAEMLFEKLECSALKRVRELTKRQRDLLVREHAKMGGAYVGKGQQR